MQHDDFEPLRGRRVPRVKRDLARQYRRNSTDAEQVLWERLRGRGLDGARFRRQHVIAGFIVDFYCHAARLAVEVDGAVHAHQVAYDAERDAALVARGVRVLRFSNDAVLGDVAGVLRVIAAALTPQPPLPEGEGEPEGVARGDDVAGEGEPEGAVCGDDDPGG